MGKGALQDRGRALLGPAVEGLARLGVSPTAVTLFGLFLNIVSGVVIGLGSPRAGGVLLLVAGACDALDGQLARRTGRASRFGAFLDSNIDRIDESVVLAGIAAWFLRGVNPWAEWLVVATLLALGGSLITSYARARAEGLGLDCKVGLMERPERLVLLILAAAAGPGVMKVVLWALAALTHFTALQRILHVKAILGREAE